MHDIVTTATNRTQLRDMLGDKPKEITEHERSLKAATFRIQ